MKLTDKVFVVTGGGNGIAREIVLGLLAKGARVAAVDLSEKGLAETAQLANAGDRLTTHALNITDRAGVEKLPDAVIAAHGQVDGLVNVAGIIHKFLPINELSFDDLERVMNVNFWGTVNTTKTFLPILMQRPEAAIVNFSSMGALAPVPGQGAYGASKAAVKLFTEGLYAELQDTNVHVSVVFPGGVSTNITGNSGVDIPMGAATSAAAAKIKTTTPEAAGAQVVAAIEKNEFRVLIGSDAVGLDRLARLSPERAITTIAKQMKSILGD